MLKPNFWEDRLPLDFIDEVIKYTDEADLKNAHAGFAKGGQARYDKCAMTGKIKLWDFHKESNEIERKISNTMYKLGIRANDFFGFDLDHNFMICQVAKYTENDQAQFGWHADDHINFEQKHRKLSFSVFLQPAEKGGKLLIQNGWEIKPNNKEIYLPYLPSKKIKEEKGGVIAFPSYYNHCVTPVEKGNRYSLVAWIFGPEWR